MYSKREQESRFGAIWSEDIWSNKGTLEVRKRCFEMASTGNYFHNEGVHFHISGSRMIVDDRLQVLSLFQNGSFLEESKLASKIILEKIYSISGLNSLTIPT